MSGPSPALPRTGPRVRIRRLAVTDLREFQAYRHDPQVGRYQGWQPQTDASALDFLAEMAQAPLFLPERWVQLGIADRASDRLIGDIGVHLLSSGTEAEIGFTIAAASQGSGLGSEAVTEAIQLIFEQTTVQRIIGITDARNTASIRLLERAGFQRVETAPAVFRGEPCEEHQYVLVRTPKSSA